MRDPGARNFGIAGILIFLLFVATLMLFGFLTYLAWNTENPWPQSKHSHSGELVIPRPMPPANDAQLGSAVLFGSPPIPPPTTMTKLA